MTTGQETVTEVNQTDKAKQEIPKILYCLPFNARILSRNNLVQGGQVTND